MKRTSTMITILSLLTPPAMATVYENVVFENGRATLPRFYRIENPGFDNAGIVTDLLDEIEKSGIKDLLILEKDKSYEGSMHEEDSEVNLIEFDDDTITVPIELFASHSINEYRT